MLQFNPFVVVHHGNKLFCYNDFYYLLFQFLYVFMCCYAILLLFI